ncbi:MAG: chromate transporter [Clostridia bacterium]|nr:chromate transporter [Clostridia bacterium]MBQ6930934.1 chromate transporter [Clostridia bacterium]
MEQNNKKESRGRLLAQLFVSFAKIGVMTFGGGLAMLPMLERELVESKKWVTTQEILDYYAVGQCTPGIIAVNTATFVGYKKSKVLGSVVATLGMVFPSLVIISVIAAVLSNFADIPAVQHAFAGIRIAVCALIASAVIKLAKSNVKNLTQIIIAVAAFIIIAVFGASPVVVVIASAIAGLLLGKFGKKEAAEK